MPADQLDEFTLYTIEDVIDYAAKLTADELTILAHSITVLSIAREGKVTQDSAANRAMKIAGLLQSGYISEEQIARINKKVAEVIEG